VRAIASLYSHGGKYEVKLSRLKLPQWRRAERTDPIDYYLLDQIDTSEQVHSEIDESPVDALLLIFFLLKYEHVVVKELLELLVGEVNAKLLKPIVLRN
jgi:hypothetical protein